jgi:hypothetical protein
VFEKLKEVRRLLLEHKDNGVKFDLGDWSITTPCGTTCCAVGLYVHHHPESELKIRVWPEYKNHVSYTAVSEYFGIPHREAVDLFSPFAYSSSQYTDPKFVIERIDKFLETHDV